MLSDKKTHLVHALSQAEWLEDWAIEFIKAKKIEGLSPNTLRIYEQQLIHFLTFCKAQMLQRVSQVQASDIRNFLLWLQERGHNPGGQHVAYRILKTFLRWYDLEAEPENWRNPISKVKAPRVAEEPLEPADIGDVRSMLNTCDSTFLGKRNRVILLSLLDTGLRARELLSLNLDDINLVTGNILLRRGKGGKPRNVFIGKETRKSVRAYLRERCDDLEAVWLIENRTRRLGYGGLRVLLKRHAKLEGIDAPSPHDFRRAFAVNSLRAGMDLETLRRLMGHADYQVLQRYLMLVDDDLRAAHARTSPADRLNERK
jgi:site-specific recombinase XerD